MVWVERTKGPVSLLSLRSTPSMRTVCLFFFLKESSSYHKTKFWQGPADEPVRSRCPSAGGEVSSAAVSEDWASACLCSQHPKDRVRGPRSVLQAVPWDPLQFRLLSCFCFFLRQNICLLF